MKFEERIKNFERIRDYIRQFYIYGFKVRQEFDAKSARTYDNERRRVESWMGNYIKSEYTKKGKQVHINVDSKVISQNPLYAAWKSKSFTDNDLMLHFFVIDELWENPDGMSAGELCDEIASSYGVIFDIQMVRLKLKEYEKLEILSSKKEGNRLFYSLVSPLLAEKKAGVWAHLMEAVKFFQGVEPFGVIGSTLLDREGIENDHFQFKHHFLVHTLEDEVLKQVLEAMRECRQIQFQNKSTRNNKVYQLFGVPLKIFVSTQTGRRYLCLYMPQERRFVNARLDCMTDVEPLSVWEHYEEHKKKLERNLKQCWGVSFGKGDIRLEEVYIKIYIDEKLETNVLERFYREARGGEVLRIRENEYLYSGAFFDTNEMLSWVKTFTGRILDIQGTKKEAIIKIVCDWEKMYQMYEEET